ncbi:MAG: hypothetical protein QGG71_22830 [Pirellulaceae bacterium]|jgi:hypothetical protein|nr:hypothetical protein [Pirellulaceae bacterium]
MSDPVRVAMIGLGFGAEIVTALVEDRDPRPGAVTSANWTSVGICAHESALRGGETVRLPEFTLSTEYWLKKTP